MNDTCPIEPLTAPEVAPEVAPEAVTETQDIPAETVSQERHDELCGCRLPTAPSLTVPNYSATVEALLEAREEWLAEKSRSTDAIDAYDTGMYDTLSKVDADLATEFETAVAE